VGPEATLYLFDPGRDHTVVLRSLGLQDARWGGQLVNLIGDFLGSYDKAAMLAERHGAALGPLPLLGARPAPVPADPRPLLRKPSGVCTA